MIHSQSGTSTSGYTEEQVGIHKRAYSLLSICINISIFKLLSQLFWLQGYALFNQIIELEKIGKGLYRHEAHLLSGCSYQQGLAFSRSVECEGYRVPCDQGGVARKTDR
ncbi:MAG: hypothetical protein RBR15_12705 [Sphaerochaeta sp.]|nr:hypothetical protein [Sphaerochaeta sp.]